MIKLKITARHGHLPTDVQARELNLYERMEEDNQPLEILAWFEKALYDDFMQRHIRMVHALHSTPEVQGVNDGSTH